MSTFVTATHKSTFRNNMELALQQKQSKMFSLGTMSEGSGELVELTNLIGQTRASRNTERHGDTKISNTPHDRRWIAKRQEIYYADYVDTADRLSAGIDLNGAYTMSGAATIRRGKDDEFMFGYYGVALTGKTGGTQVAFPAGNIGPVDIGAAAATGMNLAKLRWAIRQFGINDVDLDEEEMWCILTPQAYDNLLNEAKVDNKDFTSGQRTAMETGVLPPLYGINFQRANYGSTNYEFASLSLDTANRRVPIFCKSGVACVTWEDMFTSIDTLPQKQMSTQVYCRSTVAVTRTQEGKCLQLLCTE